MTPGQREEEAHREAFFADAEAKQKSSAAVAAKKHDEAEPFTIPGQDDARVAFYKFHRRSPNPFESQKIQSLVKDAVAAMTSTESPEKDFLMVLFQLQYFVKNLKELRGSDAISTREKVAVIMKENARVARFIMRSDFPIADIDRDNQGWYSPNLDTLELFKKRQNREPTDREAAVLLALVKEAAHNKNFGHEASFHLDHLLARFYVEHLKIPDHRSAEYQKMKAESQAVSDRHLKTYNDSQPHGWKAVAAAFSREVTKATNNFLALPGVSLFADGAQAIIHGAASLYKDATDAIDQIPFVGSAIHSGMDIMGGGALEAADAIASGKNISQTALTYLKETIADASNVAQYVAVVASFVPGVGQIGAGISGALAAANALAHGQNITDAIVQGVEDAALSAIPGGSVGKIVRKAAEEAIAVAKGIIAGKSIDHIALERLRSQLPAEAQKALDLTVAVLQGQKLQNIIVDGVKNFGPEALGKLASTGNEIIKMSAPLQNAAKGLVGKAEEGFHLATGVLSRTGIPPAALTALRAKLDPEGRVGFDKSVAAHATATALGKKMQAAVVNKIDALPAAGLQKFAAKGDARVALSVGLSKHLKDSPSKKDQDGFMLAVGVLSHKHVPPKALRSFANRLSPEARQGFDRGVSVMRRAAAAKRSAKIASHQHAPVLHSVHHYNFCRAHQDICSP